METRSQRREIQENRGEMTSSETRPPMSPIVETESGRIEGLHQDGLYVFRGVPYAAPPVGRHRWLPPQPASPWTGTREAKRFGAIAPQPPGMTPGLKEEPALQNEDCLFLNIYSPGLDGERRPVMVWIHGGAFSMGSGSDAMYRNGAIASNGKVVLVTINYRLGVLGFVNLNELTGGAIPSTGNEGLLDQIAALRWVQRNIALFGGDPENVTLFGESAGAMSIGCLLTIPQARGLFHRAILESPVGEMARPLDKSIQIAETLLRTVGVSAQDVDGLRSLPVEQLLAAQQQVAAETRQGAAPFIPAADGAVMPDMPLSSLEHGVGSTTPVLVGSNRDEDKFFSMMKPKLWRIDDRQLQRLIGRYVIPDDAAKLIECYRTCRERRGELTDPFELFSAITTDYLFRKTAVRIAECTSGYNYIFEWTSPVARGKLGACHAVEVGFVFGSHDASFCGSGPDADKLSLDMQDAWTTFARSGDPSCARLGAWPRYGDERISMILDRESRMVKDYAREERLIWNEVNVLEYSNMP